MAFHEKSNRLTAFTDGANTYTYPSTGSGQANSLGDCLQQTFNGVTTTNYTIDIAGGLTQVLSKADPKGFLTHLRY